jgi:hypothetical protein
MTWKPGSIERMPGHVKLKKNHIKVEKLAEGRGYQMTCMRQEIILQHNDFTLTELVKRKLYGFKNVSGTVYYISKNTVFRTNIQDTWMRLIFDPIAKQWDENTSKITGIMFQKMHRLEWVFS